MGLSLYYQFKAKVDADGARQLVKRLHAFVRKLPFDEVSDIVEYAAPGGYYEFERGDEQIHWKPGTFYAQRKRADGWTENVEVPGLHVVCFHANVVGSETASFGLASHPPVVVHREEVITELPGGGEEHRIGAGAPIEFVTRLRGWYSWSNCVKTQYAANPKYGGTENFLRAHLAVFTVLDECKRLRMTTRIRDDGKYWRHRDEEKLLKELQKYDELIAGFAGRLCDRLGNEPGRVVAPIKDRPDFEHLEARGGRALDVLRAKASRRSRKRKT